MPAPNTQIESTPKAPETGGRDNAVASAPSGRSPSIIVGVVVADAFSVETVLLGEFDCRQWRCERVVQFGKCHCLAKIRTAENGEAVHAVGGDVDRRADAVRQVRVV